MKEKLAGIGAVLSALLASVCCLVPIVLITLGLGGVGLAAGFVKYRLLFLALTAVLLGVAFYLTYRKREVPCADGTCEFRSGSRRMKGALWIITVLAVGMGTFPQWSMLLLSRSVPAATANAETVRLSVSGMHCAACPIGVQKALKRVPGVLAASASFEKSEAVVQVEPGKATPEELIKAVESAGPYSAEVR